MTRASVEDTPAAAAALDPTGTPADKTNKPPKERSHTGRAGLVGFVVFVLLGALLVSPFIPGKVMESLPLSSQSFSSGDQSLGCLTTPTQIRSVTKYDARSGAPLTYSYKTTTTQSANCDGSRKSAIGGHTSLFSPLALAVDALTALVVALAVTWVWRRIFGTKKHTPRHRDSE